MEKSIFEGAKFGDKFKLAKSMGVFLGDHRLYIEGYGEEFYDDYGVPLSKNQAIKDKYEIMVKWYEPLDEKKLAKLAEEEADREERELVKCNGRVNWEFIVGYKIGYKEGYRKAKQE